MIRTGLKRVPWHWILLLCVNTGVYGLAAQASSGAPMQRLLSRFTIDPLYLSLIAMMGPALTLLISPYASWKSDRIWTRFGRRKPFMLVGWGMLIPLVFLAPFVSSFWILLLIIFLWTCALDIAYEGVNTPLFYEVIPPSQRGRGAALKKGTQKVFSLLFNFYVFFQFKNVYDHTLPGTGVNLTGAHVTYFVIGLCVIGTFCNIAFNVKETKPTEEHPRESFNLVNFFRTTFNDRQWIVIYLLVFCSVALGAGLPGYLGTALIIEQFGYNERDLARKIITPEIVLNLAVIIPLAFYLADRFDRRMLFRVGLWLSTLHALATWVIIQLVGTPPIWMWIAIVSFGALVDQVAGVALEPLIFDLIPPNKMGTVNSGFVIVSRILNLLIVPCIGLFIRYYSFILLGRHGDPKQQKYDYSSGFLLIFALGVAACFVYAFFEYEFRKGRIVAYGQRPEKIEPVIAPVVSEATKNTDAPGDAE